MKIFFGAAIQGAQNRAERARVHRLIIDAIKRCGCDVVSEHTTGKDYDSTANELVKRRFFPVAISYTARSPVSQST